VRRDRAITPLPPETVERIRAALIGQGRVRDATLVSVLAYAGVRPLEAVALRWRNVRKNTLLIEQAVADGELKGRRTGRRGP
jgi:integrase